MNHTSFRSAAIILACLVAVPLTGCVIKTGDNNEGGGGSTGEGGAGGTGGAGGSGAGTACFEPTPFSAGESFVAADGDNVRTFQFTLPSDPEGGAVTITATGDQLLGEIRVADLADGNIVPLIINNDGVAEAAFVGEPGVTYEVEISESSVTATDRTVEVDVTWKLDTLRDCYEPNDTPAQAAPIALGETITAYTFAGYLANEWPSLEAHADYYAVEVDRPGTLHIVHNQPSRPDGTPLALSLSVYRQGSNDELGGVTALDGPNELEITVDAAGTYVLFVGPFSSLVYAGAPGEGVHWTQPYTLTTTLK
ncbi:hypothetical protein [Chondromyces crocatus]|uniref:Lipoprotein n=1 Tax=Chondromyces crocatus TaxID=52 RepID=A0A0K1ECC3_CHOCO|nr:hypothetical protein [Chondromyces crocatus]AKT38213.1 uncharacterized protein CMC5_023560 [Chondromyces crocatus]